MCISSTESGNQALKIFTCSSSFSIKRFLLFIPSGWQLDTLSHSWLCNFGQFLNLSDSGSFFVLEIILTFISENWCIFVKNLKSDSVNYDCSCNYY